ncbi:hypothetical protein [Herbidospora daliensis]|uniref:hypothetical protein n=1 Tax=Herbidospora daliensis TaxID=295585 RepID=UPI0007860A7C|nr:hypothetical protein [Herbidospora daliensis]
MILPIDIEADTEAADRARTVAVGATAAMMILVPTLGPFLADTREGAEEFDTEITPPDYAFAIWAPIFAVIAANAIQHAAHPTAAVNRRTGWWLVGAYTANACWSIAAQSNRFRYTPFILPVAAGLAATAHRKAQHDQPRGAERLTTHSTGLLLGWTSVASVVNAFAVQRHGKFAPTTRTGRNTARLAVAGAAVVLSTIIAASRHGHTSIALAATWALATSAANPQRTSRTRQVSAAAASLLIATTAIRLRWSRTRHGRRQ